MRVFARRDSCAGSLSLRALADGRRSLQPAYLVLGRCRFRQNDLLSSRGGVEVLDIKRGKDNDGVDDALGECVVPVPQEFVSGSEYLYDVTLELFSGEKAVRSESARIAFLPGIAAGGMTLREPDSVGWRKIKDARLFAYPPAATPEIVVEKDSSPVSRRELDAAGGFDVVLPYADMSRHGPLAVSVQSGGEKLLEAELRHYALRMPVIVR